MNRMVLLVVMLFSLLGWAEAKRPYDPSKQRPTTPEEKLLRKQWIEKRRYEHFGGDMVRPGSQKGQITIVEGESAAVVDKINSLVAEQEAKGTRVAVLCAEETKAQYHCRHVYSLGSLKQEKEISAHLFAALRSFDTEQM